MAAVVEATFTSQEDEDADDVNSKNGSTTGVRYRLAVPLDLRRSAPLPQSEGVGEEWLLRPGSTVTATYERRVSKTSSRGAIARGGGLDSATVSRMIGRNLLALQRTAGDASFVNKTNVLPSKVVRRIAALRDSFGTLTRSEGVLLPGQLVLVISEGVGFYDDDGTRRGSTATAFATSSGAFFEEPSTLARSRTLVLDVGQAGPELAVRAIARVCIRQPGPARDADEDPPVLDRYLAKASNMQISGHVDNLITD
jgi:hypothetical protein